MIQENGPWACEKLTVPVLESIVYTKTVASFKRRARIGHLNSEYPLLLTFEDSYGICAREYSNRCRNK